MVEDNKDGPQSTFSTYLAEGDKLFTEGHYEKALSYYNQALELESDNRIGLVARSKCYLAIGDRKTALEDAEASLTEDKTFVKGVYQKAEVLYSMGEFEFALVYYERGRKLRPELAEFRLGIQKAKEAIGNSVGGPDVVKLEKKGDLTYFKQQESQAKKKKPGKQVGMIQRQDKVEKKRSPPLPYGSKQTVRSLLGELNSDKEYLEGIFSDKDMMENDRLGLRDLVIDGLEYLDRRTEFWRQQQPIYSRKRDKYLRNIKPPITIAVGASIRKGHAEGDQSEYVRQNLEEIEEALNDMRLDQGYEQGEALMKYMEKLDDRVLTDKSSLLATLHALLGNLLLSLNREDEALKHFMMDRDLSGRGPVRNRCLENLGRVYFLKEDYSQAIDMWNERLTTGDINAEELAWVYHEIGRANFELGRWKDSREYGEKALTAAEEASDKLWQLNALVLIAQSLVKNGDFKLAMQNYEQAKQLAESASDQAAKGAIESVLIQLKEGMEGMVRGITGDEGTDMRQEDVEDNIVTEQEDMIQPE
ncbi:Tetratricopeptide repeat protein 25 [Oopsacas minuta]|uniref:Outer dynein arm-docking complex subunit 4 n=1 Tax=Oopsacas minuta TaxID=111878 RepID=A0AAV7K1K2_9METZ|nr:Tetratricopeptide repeat protein 25 [Oopsacas minuta]